MSGIFDVLTDRAVLASLALALAVVALPAAVRLKVPASLAWVPASLVGLWVAGAEDVIDPYIPPLRSYHWLSGPVIGLAVVLLVVAAHRSTPRRGGADQPGARLTVFMAAVAAGIFLCIPETGLLRLLPGPMVVIAAAVVLGLARPMGVSGALGLALPLAWISVVDGQARATAVVGAAACFAAAWLLVVASGGWSAASDSASRPDQSSRNHWIQLMALALAVLVSSRLAAMIDSVVLVLMLVAVVQMMAAGVLWQAAATPSVKVRPADPVEERR